MGGWFSRIAAGATLSRIAIALVFVGIAYRIVGFLTAHVLSDAASYGVMAQSFLRNGEFIMPLGEYWSPSWAPAFSHHYPPAYPLYLAPFVAVGGLNPWTLKLASTVSSFLFLGAVFWTTRDLYGRDKALLVLGIAAVDPVLIGTGSTGYSEDLLSVFFVLTIWAILRSLKDDRYIVLAGLFAGVAYLTKSSVGWFFLIAGIAGFLWRFYYIRWRVLRNRWYLAAIAIFFAFVGLWSLRNLRLFWDGSAAQLFTAWQGSAYFGTAAERAASNPGDLAFILAVRLPFYAALFLFVGGPWLTELRRTPKLSDEHYSGLWLAVGLTYLLAWVISGIYWTLERSPVFWLDQARYVVIANVIVLWLVVKDADIRMPRFRRRYAALAAVWLVASTAVLAQGTPGVFPAYEILRDRAAPGDIVAVDGLLRYEVLVNAGPDLTYVKYVPGVVADFILTSDTARTFAGYTLVGIGRSSGALAGFVPTFDAAVWQAT